MCTPEAAHQARLTVGRLIAWEVVFRLCGLAGGPFYEDEFYRYLRDAYRFAQDGTPYGVAPETFFSATPL